MGHDNNNANSSHKSTSTVRATPKLLLAASQEALACIAPALTGAMKGCEEAFVQLADCAGSNSEQTLYFESLRELRENKQTVLDSCQRLVGVSFETAGTPADPAPTAIGAPPGGLSLVADDSLEQDLALSTMAARARTDNQAILYQLKCQLEIILGDQPVAERDNPLDPASLGLAFKTATSELKLHIKARIVLFKHFERELSDQLPGLYRAVNQLFLEAGILPTKNYKVESDTDNIETTESIQNSNFDLNSFAPTLQKLRELHRQPASFIPAYSWRSGPVVNQQELVRMLADLQSLISYEDMLRRQAIDIRTAVERIMLALDKEGAEEFALTSRDEDIVNLMVMFFEFLLTDQTLPLSFQTLLGRLQLPLLKLALQDADFFESDTHPARVLINDIAHLGLGHVDGDNTRDVVKETIESIVRDSYENSQVDAAQFQQFCGKLHTVAQDQLDRAERVEKRARETARGQAKTRAARNHVHKELYSRLYNAELPARIFDFLLHDWQEVLLLTLLRQGDDSAEWLEALQLIDDLIWSVGQHNDDKSRSRRGKLLPALRESMRKGLTNTLDEPAEIDALVRTVEDIQQQIQQQDAGRIDYRCLSTEEASKLQTDTLTKDWQDMTAQERQQAKQERVTYDHIRQADSIKPGTWMLFEDPTSDTIMRCKLVTKLEDTDTFIFVNRFGFKVLEQKRKTVAYNLQRGVARIIDSRPIFDRACARIAESLREMGEVAAS